MPFGLAQLVALPQLADVVLAALRRDLVREVGRVDERLIADDLQREGQRQLLRLAADEQAALVDLLDDVLVGALASRGPKFSGGTYWKCVSCDDWKRSRQSSSQATPPSRKARRTPG